MKTIYRCDICDRDYSTPEEAISCEEQEPLRMGSGSFLRDTDTAEVGDLVSCGGHYSWWDGEDDWKSDMKPGHRFWDFVHLGKGREYAYHPLWVVVDIFVDTGHVERLVLATPSDASGTPWVATTSERHNYIENHGKASAAQLKAVEGLYNPAEKKRIPII